MKKNLLTLTIAATILFGGTHTQAQESTYTRLREFAAHIAAFNKNCPQEKVFLHFDNKAYYLGETIWFSAYVVDAGTLLPIAKSKILYVELLTPDGDIVASKKLKIVAGRCYGNLDLIGRSETFSEGFSNKINVINALRSGFYEVRAYTREMQNFGEGCYFSRVFPVYDAPETDGDYAQMQFTTTNTTRSTEVRKKSKKQNNPTVEFYPEGGTLVEGIQSRIGFRITDNKGLPINDTNAQSTGKQITDIREGMGSFLHTPNEADNNKVTFTIDGKEESFKLPKAEKKGYTLSIDNMQKQNLEAEIARSGVHPETIGATIICRGILTYFDTLRWEGDKARITIDKSKMPAGVQQLTLFTEKGKIVAERLFFSHNNLPNGINISISTDKPAYKPFEKVNLNAKVTDRAGTPIETYISLAVRDGDVENGGNYSDNICTDLLLSSDLKGYISNPEYYFESNDGEHLRALDNLMLVQGWRRYGWETMAGTKPFKVTNYLEDGITIDGEVYALSYNKPLKDIKVRMRAFSPDGKYVQSQSVTTNEKGEFNFKLEDFYDDWHLILFLSKDDAEDGNEERLKKDARIKINRAPMSQKRIYAQWETNTPNPIVHYPTSTKPLDKATQVQDFLVLPGIEIKEQENYLDCEAYYVREESEAMYDKGELLGNVNQYLLEKAPRFMDEEHTTNIMSYKNTPITYIPMRFEGSVWGSTIPPQYSGLIDLEEVEYILFFNNPFAYQHLRLSHKNMYPDSPLIDLINHSASEKKYLALIYPRKRTAVTYDMKGQRATYVEGYSTVREFFSPDYKNAPLPGETDYRRTLYWNPLLRTDAKGNAKATFYNNGRCHIMEADASTITPKGKLGSGKTKISPKK